jgi:hypothetical protein
LRFGASEGSCQSCNQIYPASDLDRYLWCPACRKAVRGRGVRWGRLVGSLATLAVVAYLALRVNPSTRYFAFYALMLGMTYLLTSRIAVAVVQGYYRSRGSINSSPEASEPR